MKREERKKERNTHVCSLCGKEILPDIDEEPIYIKTKRGSELWVHKRDCEKRNRHE